MGASLMQQRRVRDEGLRVVKRFSGGREGTVLQEEGSANYVPAAAVKRRSLALSEFTGRKARAGGFVSGL
jgi:lipoate-protein ligase A